MVTINEYIIIKNMMILLHLHTQTSPGTATALMPSPDWWLNTWVPDIRIRPVITFGLHLMMQLVVMTLHFNILIILVVVMTLLWIPLGVQSCGQIPGWEASCWSHRPSGHDRGWFLTILSILEFSRSFLEKVEVQPGRSRWRRGRVVSRWRSSSCALVARH